ncbi:MAG: T9SS type A sorting domain-containing protein [Flavobacteriales bacterium]
MRYLFAFHCIAFALSSSAQAPFAHSYLLSRPTHINGSTLTPDGGLMLCGYASDGADSLRMGRGFVIRTDASGEVLWVREHDGGYRPVAGTTVPFSNIAYTDIHTNPDSSVLLVGSAFESFYLSNEFLAMGMDPLGDTLWTRFPTFMSGGNSFNHIVPATSGSAFVYAVSSTGINTYLDVEKMDVHTGLKSAVSEIWPNNDAGITSLRPTFDSGCVSAGHTSDAGLELWVRISDSDLNTQWQTTFGLAWFDSYSTCLIAEQAPDASVWGVVVPSHYSLPTKPFQLMHFTAGGAINSNATFTLPGTAVPADMRIKPNGKMLIAGTGYLDVYNDSSYAFLMQVDPVGTVDWAWRYDGEPGDSLKLVSMEVVPGSGDVFLIGSARTGRPLIIRTDSMGMAGGCAQQALSPVLGSMTWNTGTMQGSTSNGPVSDLTEHFVPNDAALYSIVHEQCGGYQQLYRATGNVYYDADGNGGLDPGEVGLAWYPIGISPATGLVFTNSSGNYELVTDIADTFTITPSLPQQWWAITSDSAAYHPTFTATDTLFEDLDFGYDPVLDTTILVGSHVLGVSCNFPFAQHLRVRNSGTTTPQGVVSYTYDPSMQLLNAQPPMDSTSGQTIYWHFDSLWFGAIMDIDMEFQLIPFTWVVGDTLNTGFTVFSDDGLGNLSVVHNEQIARVITCSYDPNNKEVLQEPLIPADQGWLNYTINFQNTGTDTANTVFIEDQLSQHLQWNTLQFLGASHDLTGLSINAGGKATFRFDNINLPDSNANELESHGFVTYRIAPQPGLPHLTRIENNTGIFFDQNLPVITNTVVSTIVDCATATHRPITIVDFGTNTLYAYTGTNDTMTYAYQWNVDGSVIPGGNGIYIPNDGIGAVLLAQVTGTYSVEFTDEFGCTFSSDPYPFIILASPELQGLHMKARPNPFTDATVLFCDEVLGADFGIELIDVHGRVARTLQGNGTREVSIERGALQSGLYMVRVLDAHGQRTAVRVVVE